MNATEIRKEEPLATGELSALHFLGSMAREIAAQLAELNDKLAPANALEPPTDDYAKWGHHILDELGVAKGDTISERVSAFKAYIECLQAKVAAESLDDKAAANGRVRSIRNPRNWQAP